MDEGVGYLMSQQLARIEDERHANAYGVLVLGFARRGYTLALAARAKGRKSDIHFQDDSGDRPYSFIVNKNDLLFYFRAKAPKPNFADSLLEMGKDEGDEITVRVKTEADALAVLALVDQ